jgi:hypothetical protein
MKRALPWRNNIRVLGLEPEESTPVVQHYTCIAGYDAGPEGFEKAIDE